VVIGGIAGYIAWRQYKVAHAKLKLDLFDRRFVIAHWARVLSGSLEAEDLF
jgi:hypothetical protein